ncbi:hypothetical protein [Vibrio breoganii]|uniref:hypothetical protein n=1 Tax=Vibrio breoganii TaxID=553239 RepID=UPI000C83DD26|nr:hypothetical protein [Vibrio breoganii]PMG94677.1 hypothetical protein BCU79_01080 [Vibrio breoganii]PMK41084.1 hypothetical protein BCU00_01825 [Vibrio breoganii]
MITRLVTALYSIVIFVFILVGHEVITASFVLLSLMVFKLPRIKTFASMAFVFILMLSVSFLSPYDSWSLKVAFSINLSVIIFLFMDRPVFEKRFLFYIRKILSNLFYLYFVLFFIVLVYSHVYIGSVRLGWESATDVLGRSVNYHITYFVLLLIYYLYVNLNKINIYNLSFTVFSLVLLLSTGSRAIIPIILLISLVICLLTDNRYFLVKYFVAFSILLMIIVFHDIIFNLITQSRAVTRSLDSPRSMLINEYISLSIIGLKEIFFGGDFYRSPGIVDFGYNAHNSFIRSHSMFGLLGLIFSILYLIFSFYLANKVSLSFGLIMITVLLLRALLDSVMLFSSADLIFVVIIISVYKSKSRSSEKTVYS